MEQLQLLLDFPLSPHFQGEEGSTCRTCKHRQPWQCGGSIIQYCGITRSNRTINGLKKIKCKNPACSRYCEQKN